MSSPKQTPFKPDATVRAFLAERRAQSSADVVTTPQIIRLVAAAVALLVFFCWDYKIFWVGLLFALCAFYLATLLFKAGGVALALLFRPDIRIDDRVVKALDDADLPVYTVLVPMYKEQAVAEKVVRAVNGFDYPHDKLDVKLLLEEDDHETIAVCERIDLPDCCEVIIAPNSFPKTKPKACNHGLFAARGKFLVIYDAEDRPEPDQLKKAVAAFDRAPPHVICLQAKLNYFNPDQNILTKWFALEYTAWFDLFLPGLHLLGAPVPLGGTSNHFRVNILRELGGWDPFNVTEDCDLGIRLHGEGFRTRVLDSTTWEEANSRLGNWIRQRSRWVKGYIQTHLVHTRRPLRTLLRLGPFGTFCFLMSVGGLSITLLLNPLFWIVLLALGLAWAGHLLGFDVTPWRMLYFDHVSDMSLEYTLWSRLSWVFFGVSAVLFFANVLFVGVNVVACLRRGLIRLLAPALLSPFYWALISIAAWKGALQLLVRPFYWEKTEHGLDDGEHSSDDGGRP